MASPGVPVSASAAATGPPPRGRCLAFALPGGGIVPLRTASGRRLAATTRSCRLASADGGDGGGGGDAGGGGGGGGGGAGGVAVKRRRVRLTDTPLTVLPRCDGRGGSGPPAGGDEPRSPLPADVASSTAHRLAWQWRWPPAPSSDAAPSAGAATTTAAGAAAPVGAVTGGVLGTGGGGSDIPTAAASTAAAAATTTAADGGDGDPADAVAVVSAVTSASAAATGPRGGAGGSSSSDATPTASVAATAAEASELLATPPPSRRLLWPWRRVGARPAVVAADGRGSAAEASVHTGTAVVAVESSTMEADTAAAALPPARRLPWLWRRVGAGPAARAVDSPAAAAILTVDADGILHDVIPADPGEAAVVLVEAGLPVGHPSSPAPVSDSSAASQPARRLPWDRWRRRPTAAATIATAAAGTTAGAKLGSATLHAGGWPPWLWRWSGASSRAASGGATVADPAMATASAGRRIPWLPWLWRRGGASPRAASGGETVAGAATAAVAAGRRRFPWPLWRTNAAAFDGAAVGRVASGATARFRFPWQTSLAHVAMSVAGAARRGSRRPRAAFRFPWQRPPAAAAAAPTAPTDTPAAAADGSSTPADASAPASGVHDEAAAAAAPGPGTATAPRLYLDAPPPAEVPPPPLSPSNAPAVAPAGGNGTAAFPRTAYEVPLPLPRRALTLTVVPVAAPKQLKRSAVAVVAAFGPAAAGLLARAVRGGAGVASAHAATAPHALSASGCVAGGAAGTGAAAAGGGTPAAAAAKGVAAAVSALGAPVSAVMLPAGELFVAAAARVQAAFPAFPPLLVLPPTSPPERILSFALFLLLPELARIVWRDLHHSDIALRTASASPPLLARITTPVNRHTALVVVTGAAYLAGLYVAALSSVVAGGLLVLVAGLVFNLSARVKVWGGRVEAVGVRQRGDVLVANALAAALVGGVGLLGGVGGVACATGGLVLVVCYWAVRYVFVLSPGVAGRRLRR